MKVFSDGYYTVVASNIGEARDYFVKENLCDEDYIPDIVEIDPTKKKMYFPLDELPEQYHDETKYPKKLIDYDEAYIGVKITLAEAMRYKKESLPYILSVSSDLV